MSVFLYHEGNMLPDPSKSEALHRFVRAPSPLLGGTQNINMLPIPRKRASSFKKPREKNIDVFLTDDMRPRTCSMPTKNTYKKPSLLRTHLGLHFESDSDRYTVRTFKINSKGVIVDRSDSMRSRSTNSVISSEGDLIPLSPSSRTSSSVSRDSLGPSPGPQTPKPCIPSRVSVLGAEGVGKTALTQQFMTSEYLGGFDTSVDHDGEKPVNVLIDGEESALLFNIEREQDEKIPDYRPDSISVYVIVYACDDKKSFDEAVDILYKLRQQQHREEIIMLVGNKSDLVRSRAVTFEEAKAVAMTYDCKFVETSVVLNVNVDELLVGIVKQIRIRNADGYEKCTGCTSTSKLLLNKLFHRDSISKSCENLYS